MVEMPYDLKPSDFEPDEHGRPFHVWCAKTQETLSVSGEQFREVAKANNLSAAQIKEKTRPMVKIAGMDPATGEHSDDVARMERLEKLVEQQAEQIAALTLAQQATAVTPTTDGDGKDKAGK